MHHLIRVCHMLISPANSTTYLHVMQPFPLICPFHNFERLNETTYRNAAHLDYPINQARSIARETIGTLYYLSADIELFPSVNLIPMFLDFVKRESAYLTDRKKRKTAFVLPWFEMENGYDTPRTKDEAVSLFKKEALFTFAHKYCPECHRIPNLDKWMSQNHTGKALFS